MNLWQLMVTSMREGENEQGQLPWGCLGWLMSSTACAPSPATQCLLCCPSTAPHPCRASPMVMEVQLEWPGSMESLVVLQRGCCCSFGRYKQRFLVATVPEEKKKGLGKSDTGENFMLTDISLCFILHQGSTIDASQLQQLLNEVISQGKAFAA